MVRTDERVVLHYRPVRRLFGRSRLRLVDREPEPDPPEPRVSRVPWSLLLLVAVAVLLGVLVGLAPAPVGLGLVGVVAVVAMLARLEWAALAVVATAVFEDYLALVSPAAIKALGILLVLAWVIRRCQGRIHDGRRSAVLTAALVFTATLLISTSVHNNGLPGLEVLARYGGFLAVLVVLADVVRAGLSADRVARVYVASCAVAAACGLVSYAVGVDRRVGGPIGDPNDFAFFLLPAIALGLGVRRTARRRWPWDLATVMVLVAVLGTFSRGAILGLVAMVVLAVGARMIRIRTAFGLAVLVAAGVLAVVATLPGLVATSIEQKGVVADQNVSERFELWSAATKMTLESPVVGLGPGAFALDHDDYTSGLPADVNHPLDVAHNTWLELSSELGVLGLLAFAALLVTAFGTAWSAWRRRHDPVAAATAVALVGTAVAATFVTEQYYLPLWLLCALAVGVGARAEVDVEAEERPR
ncbi:MAG: O-antigen ligase family protein [Nocardioides sp.]